MLYHGGLLFDGEKMLPAGHALLEQDGVIREVGPIGAFSGYEGPHHDLGGATLLPGLLDCHVHLTMSGDGQAAARGENDLAALALTALAHAQAALRGGVTALRDCGGIDHVAIAVRDACDSGRFLGPTIRAAGRLICMTGGTKWQIASVADGPAEVVKAVRLQILAGCDCVKLMATGAVLHPGTGMEEAQYTEVELAAGVAEARRFGKPSAAHAIGTAGILNAARAGVDSIEHGVFMTDECIREMLERHIFLVPTLSALEHLLENERAVPPASLAKAQRAAEHHRRSVREYWQAGGRIAMGTDAGTLCNPHGGNALELHYLVEVGVTPTDALKAATAGAADLLRLDTRGRLRARHVADLLIVDGDPTRDISFAARREHHRMIVKAGRSIAL